MAVANLGGRRQFDMSIKNSAILAAFTLATFAAAPVFAAPAPRPTAALTEAAPVATKSARLDSDAARYAKRETRAKKQQNYQGGSVLVIGVSTGAAIVILVLVLLLI
jgi:hypothetical protein